MPTLRHALRSLRRSPGFTVTVILTLTLCLGANCAIFSVLDAILLRPYPWAGSERLVYVHNSFPKLGGVGSGISIPDYLDHRAGVPAFAETALITGFNANLADGDAPERVYGLAATPSLFSLLQAAPARGRAFTAAEAEPGAARTVVLTDAFWRNRFGADPAAVGRTIRLNGEAFTIIGVMPPGFYFPSLRAQLFVPFAFTPRQRSEAERTTQYSTMLARLAPGATLAQAQREVDAVHRAARERLPELRGEYAATGYGSAVLGFLETNVKDVRAMLWLLQAGVVVALLIGCANVVNLLLARATARQREFAIRTALGAGRGHLVVQLLAECLLLFAAGGGLGLLAATWGLGAVNALGIGNLPRGFGVALDGRIFAITLLGTAVAGLASGLLPAVLATRPFAGTFQLAGARHTAGRRQLTLRGTLVVAQISLSLVLLATAGLLVRSFARMQEQSPGFAADHVLTASLALPAATYATPEARAAFAAAVTDRLAAAPGVTAVGLVNAVPFGGANPRGGYEIVDRPAPAGQANPNGYLRQVSPGYFSALGIPLLRGRLLEPGDVPGREPVVVVDRFFAERHFPGEDPIGRRIRRDQNTNVGTGTWTIVGVVATVKGQSLEETVARETIYFPFAQSPPTALTLVVRAASDPTALARIVRDAVLAVDPAQPVYDLKTMAARLDESLQRRRAPMLLLAVFAGLALALAAVGLYGVLAFSVGQRTSEFGVRMALGADRAAILRLVLKQGAILVGAGLALGSAGCLATAPLLAGQLFGIAPADVPTLLGALWLLAAVAVIACLVPAHRATRVDPMIALRSE